MKRLTPEMRRTIHSAEGRNKPKPITLPKVPGLRGEAAQDAFDRDLAIMEDDDYDFDT